MVKQKTCYKRKIQCQEKGNSEYFFIFIPDEIATELKLKKGNNLYVTIEEEKNQEKTKYNRIILIDEKNKKIMDGEE